MAGSNLFDTSPLVPSFGFISKIAIGVYPYCCNFATTDDCESKALSPINIVFCLANIPLVIALPSRWDSRTRQPNIKANPTNQNPIVAPRDSDSPVFKLKATPNKARKTQIQTKVT